MADLFDNKPSDECQNYDDVTPCQAEREKNQMYGGNLQNRVPRQAQMGQNAATLGKWLWILFWLFIPSMIAVVMTNKNIVKYFPQLNAPGQILNAVCLLLYAGILLKLGPQNAHYKTSAICRFLAWALSTATVLILLSGNGIAFGVLLTFAATAIGYVGEYHECMAHSAVVSGVDNNLSGKWVMIWKWQVWLLCGIVGSLLLALIIPLLGVLVALAASVGVIVVGIMKLVYLYRTACLFRTVAEQNPTVEF